MTGRQQLGDPAAGPSGPAADETRTLTGGSPALPLAEAARRLGATFDETARAAARRLPLRFPAGYLELADPADPADPIRRIAWPDPEELVPDPGAIADPVGEEHLRPIPVLVRKYSDRALLLLTSRCHFYCRFCFRAGAGADATLDDVRDAARLLAADPDVVEVILSGGDPLVLPDAFLAETLRIMGTIPSLRAVRIHTRAPVHDPLRITPALVAALADAAPAALWIAIHVTHPRELTPAFDAAVRELQRASIPLLAQTVLLAGVNDDVDTLAELMRGLYARGVKPYYLHHPDRVAGTARFRVSIERGRALHRALRGRVPGPALPAYVLDLPDGSGKVPVESLVPDGERTWRITLPDGRVTTYQDVL